MPFQNIELPIAEEVRELYWILKEAYALLIISSEIGEKYISCHFFLVLFSKGETFDDPVVTTVEKGWGSYTPPPPKKNEEKKLNRD